MFYSWTSRLDVTFHPYGLPQIMNPKEANIGSILQFWISNRTSCLYIRTGFPSRVYAVYRAVISRETQGRRQGALLDPVILEGVVTRSIEGVVLHLGYLGVAAMARSLADAATGRVHLGVALALELVVEDAG